MMPSCDQIGVPLHFHSSMTSGSASLMSLRILRRVSPRQSPRSAILCEMSSDGDWTWLAPDFFMFSSYPGYNLWIGTYIMKATVKRKNFYLDEKKIRRAQRILGTKTETETIDKALDLIVFGKEIRDSLRKVAGKGGVEKVF